LLELGHRLDKAIYTFQSATVPNQETHPQAVAASIEEAAALLRQALHVLDQHNAGISATPHIDLALNLLERVSGEIPSTDQLSPAAPVGSAREP
jgi:hypothetical protein